MGGRRDALHAQKNRYVEPDEVRETKIPAQLSCIVPNGVDAHRKSLIEIHHPCRSVTAFAFTNRPVFGQPCG